MQINSCFFRNLLALFLVVQCAFVFSEEKEFYRDSIQYYAGQDVTDSVKIENLWQFKVRNTLPTKLDIELYQILIELARRSGAHKKECFYLREAGFVYQMNGATMEANECYTKSIEVGEKNQDTSDIINGYYKQGYLMEGIGKHQDAINSWKKILNYRKDIFMQGFIHMAIGAAYMNMDSIDLALIHNNKSYEIWKEDSNAHQIHFTMMNLSQIYLSQNDLERAERYAREAIEYATKFDDWGGIAISKLSLARVLKARGLLKEAREIYEEIKLVYDKSKINNYDLQSFAYERYEINRKAGYEQEALEALELAYSLLDTIFQLESQKSLDDAMEKHNSEKNQLEIEKQKLRAENEEAQKQDAQKSKTFQFYVFLGIVVVLILNVGFIYGRFRLTKKQNRIIEFQKDEIEEKQKEILDSITYAKRLQQAILATEDSIRHYFPDSFLYYQPKDIVAGDFYFFETTETHIFYAAADCTGHGVPGAMMSIVCANALSRSIKEFGQTDPGKILDKTRELVVETFEKSGQNVKDGMDISFLAKNLKTGEIKWAGAHNPLWYITDGVLHEIKPDKQSIGKTENTSFFSTHTINLSNSILYLITDGYADQFGGDKGKKFKASNLKELLIETSKMSMEDQYKKLHHTFESWRGSLEQIDDVCVLGIRI